MLDEFQYVRTSHDFLLISPTTYDDNADGNTLNSSIYPLKFGTTSI